MQQQHNSNPSLSQMVDSGTRILCIFLSAFTMPIEVILRPFYGSRYFASAAPLFSSLAMLALAMIADAYGAIPPILRAAHIEPPTPPGLFTLMSFTKLFLFLAFIHGIRTAWLRLDLSRENHSEFEGPALLPITLIPFAERFWICRIWIEPAVVFLTAQFMERLTVFDSSLSNFLSFAALCLVMKEYLVWNSAWKFARGVLDSQYSAPIIAGLLDDSAKPKDLEKLHLATLPKGMPPDVKRATVEHMVRIFTQSDYTAPKGGNNAADK